MTPNKAIKTQVDYLRNPCPVLPQDVREAMLLGSEALKAIILARKGVSANIYLLLPGETEEGG